MKIRLVSVVLCLFLCSSFCFAQNVSLQNVNLQDTVWQNSTRVVHFFLDENALSIRLKNYYGLWLDTEYKIEYDFEKNPLLVLDNDLYVRYWNESSSEKKFYLPCANFSEITLDKQVTDENVYGYYINDEAVFTVRYWKCSGDIFDSEKLIFLKIDENNSVQIPKFLKIGDDFYTCIQGRGEKLRNIQKMPKNDFLAKYPQIKFDSPYMVLSPSYLKKVD